MADKIITKRPVALLTGASGGIGLEISRELARRGFDLVLASRGVKKLEAVREELAKEFGAQAWVVAADLSQPGDDIALFRECDVLGLRVEMLVNNAGVGLFGESITQDRQEVEKMISLNVVSLTTLSSLFAERMSQTGGGRILNVASLVGLFPVPFFAAYGASKSYVLSYSLALRAEVRRFGVSVTTVLPGFVATGFDDAAGIGSEGYRKLSRMMAMKPERVAKIAVRAAMKRKAKVVAGFSNKLSAFFLGLIPRNFLAGVTHSLISSLSNKSK
jgi:hypothetical protein